MNIIFLVQISFQQLQATGWLLHAAVNNSLPTHRRLHTPNASIKSKHAQLLNDWQRNNCCVFMVYATRR